MPPKTWPMAVLALLLGVPAHAGWVPTDCSARSAEVERFNLASGVADPRQSEERFRRLLENPGTAKRFGMLHPYPQSPEDLADNARYSFLSPTRDETGDPSPPREGRIFEALKTGRYRVEILEVENWDVNRCAGGGPHTLYYLVRFFDPKTGDEIARCAEFPSGLVNASAYSVKEEALADEIPKLSDLPALLSSLFSFTAPVEQPEYVMAEGLPATSLVSPSIAFKSQGDIYLLTRNRRLYKLDATAPRISLTAHQTEERETRHVSFRTHFIQPTISLGAEWGTVGLVGGTP